MTKAISRGALPTRDYDAVFWQGAPEMWKSQRHVYAAGTVVLAAFVLLSATAQTQSAAPVASLTEKLGFNAGTTGNINTTGSNLLVACVSSYGGNNVPVPQLADSKGNSWTLAATMSGQWGYDTSIYSSPLAAAYRVQTTAAAVNPTWSYSVSHYANTVMAAFKTADGGSTPGGRLLNIPEDLLYMGAFRPLSSGVDAENGVGDCAYYAVDDDRHADGQRPVEDDAGHGAYA